MPENESDALAPTQLSRRHFRFGWASLCVFVVLGAALDLMQAFKVGFYLDVGSDVRRLMWTLAHAHGLGLALLHLGFATTVRLLFDAPNARLRLASRCLIWASVLMPLGFFLGGIATHGSDPGPAVLAVPIGGVLLIVGCGVATREVFRAGG